MRTHTHTQREIEKGKVEEETVRGGARRRARGEERGRAWLGRAPMPPRAHLLDIFRGSGHNLSVRDAVQRAAKLFTLAGALLPAEVHLAFAFGSSRGLPCVARCRSRSADSCCDRRPLAGGAGDRRAASLREARSKKKMKRKKKRFSFFLRKSVPLFFPCSTNGVGLNSFSKGFRTQIVIPI